MVPCLFACIKDVCEAECHDGTSPKHALNTAWMFVAAFIRKSGCIISICYCIVCVEQWRERGGDREREREREREKDGVCVCVCVCVCTCCVSYMYIHVSVMLLLLLLLLCYTCDACSSNGGFFFICGLSMYSIVCIYYNITKLYPAGWTINVDNGAGCIMKCLCFDALW